MFRGGGGIYYNPNQTNSFTFLNTNPPFSHDPDLYSSPTRRTVSLANPFSPAGVRRTAGRRTVMTDNWNLPTAA